VRRRQRDNARGHDACAPSGHPAPRSQAQPARPSAFEASCGAHTRRRRFRAAVVPPACRARWQTPRSHAAKASRPRARPPPAGRLVGVLQHEGRNGRATYAAARSIMALALASALVRRLMRAVSTDSGRFVAGVNGTPIGEKCVHRFDVHLALHASAQAHAMSLASRIRTAALCRYACTCRSARTPRGHRHAGHRGGSRTCTAIAQDGHSPPADRYRLRPFDRQSK